MTKPIARDPMYRKRAFDADIIQLCVRWYISYRLSYRDLVEMMAERGIGVAHTTILRWVTRYVPEFEKRWNRFAQSSGAAAGRGRRNGRWHWHRSGFAIQKRRCDRNIRQCTGTLCL